MTQPTFTCACCGGVFDKEWSDEEAVAERDELFPYETEFDVVCDDCFKLIVPTKARELDL